MMYFSEKNCPPYGFNVLLGVEVGVGLRRGVGVVLLRRRAVLGRRRCGVVRVRGRPGRVAARRVSRRGIVSSLVLFVLSWTGDGLLVLVRGKEFLEVFGGQSLQFSWFGLSILQQL